MEDITKSPKKRGRKPKYQKTEKNTEERPTGYAKATGIEFVDYDPSSFKEPVNVQVFSQPSILIQDIEKEDKPSVEVSSAPTNESDSEQLKEQDCDVTSESTEALQEEDERLEAEAKEKDTRELLEYLGMHVLPSHINSEYWIRGVAKVLKTDGSVSWCVVIRTGYETHKIEKIFGSCAAIFKVGRIRNIEVIPNEYINIYGFENKANCLKFLLKHYGKAFDDLEFMTDEELKNKAIDVVIKKYASQYGK